MKPRHAVSLFAASLVFVAFPCQLAAKATSPTYDDLMKQARERAAENSWALARDAFAAAQPLAPDENAKRWIGLWLEDAIWHAEDVPSEWRARRDWQDRHEGKLNALVATYQHDQERDEFWAAVMHSKLDFAMKLDRRIDELGTPLEIADFWGSRPVSRDTIASYLDILQYDTEPLTGREFNEHFESSWQAHLERAVGLARDPRERALFLVLAARHREMLKSLSVTDRAARWDEVAKAAKGTTIEPLADSLRFLFYTLTGFDPGSTAESPADIPAVIAEAESLKSRLEPLLVEETAQSAATLREARRAESSIADLVQFLREPTVMLEVSGELEPGASLKLKYGASGISGLRVSVFRQSPEGWSFDPQNKGAFFRSSSTFAVATPDEAEHVRRNALAMTSESRVSLEDPSKLGWHSGELDLDEHLGPGLYTILVESTRQESSRFYRAELIVSRAAATTLTASPALSKIFFFSKETGEPIAGQEFKGLLFDGKDHFPVEAKTDADGAMSLDEKAGETDANLLRTIGSIGDNPVDAMIRVGHRAPPKTADLIMDRPLFRPGETARWKLVLRERVDGHFKPLSDRVFMSVIDQDGGALVRNADITTNEFGTAHGEFLVPKSARPGYCRVLFSRTQSFEGSDPFFTTAFLVDNFVPPATSSSIELASPAESLQPGSDFRIRVHSSYYSGGPVVGAPVTIELNAYATWDEGETSTKQDFQKWREEFNHRAMSAVTDANGDAQFTLSIPRSTPDRTTIRVHARVMPAGAPETHSDAGLSINRMGLRLRAEGGRETPAVRPGETVDFRFRVIDGMDRPVAFSGQAELIELSWNEAWLSPEGQIVFEDAPRESRQRLSRGWKLLYSGYSRRAVDSTPVQTSGAGTSTVRFKIPREGIYQLQLSRSGESLSMEDNYARLAPLSVIAADENTTSLPIKPDSYLFGQTSFTLVSPLKLLAIVPDKSKWWMLAVAGENEVKTQRLKPAGNVMWIDATDLPRFAGAGTATLFAPADSSDMEGSLRFDVPDPSRILNLTIDPGKEVSAPGSDASVVIRALDSSGKPAPAEVLLSVSDESVMRLSQGRDRFSGSDTFANFKSIAWSLVEHQTRRKAGIRQDPIRDPRAGAIRSPTGFRITNDDEIVLFSPLGVASSVDGYRASSTLAGSRLAAMEEERMTAMELSVPVPKAGSSGPEIITRSFFAFTAAWLPELRTDSNGEAKATFKYPDNLTEWHFDVVGLGADGDTFGRVSTHTKTSLPLQARLQSPRFLTEGDTSDFSVLVLNRSGVQLVAETKLSVDGAASLGRTDSRAKQSNPISPEGEDRVAWSVVATKPGDVMATASASSRSEGDSMQISLPVNPDGFWQKTAASACVTSSSGEQVMRLELPDSLDSSKARATVTVSPGHVAAVLDALPYLVDYPYGCVEQTMSRFLPAIVVRQSLNKLGVSAKEVYQRIAATEPTDVRRRREMSAGILSLDEVVESSLGKLREAQTESGGFGWWPGEKNIDPWMTAYVLWGISLARSSGLKDSMHIEDHARDALCNWISSNEVANHELAWAVMSASGSEPNKEQENVLKKAFDQLMRERARLGPAGRACLAIAAKRWGTVDEQSVLLSNLENGAQHSRAGRFGDTVHWGMSSGYWRASDGAVESTALTLIALHELKPEHPLIEPAARWLELNRKSSGWSNTRDTAMAVLALSRLIPQTKALDSGTKVTVSANNGAAIPLPITREALITGRLEVEIPTKALKPGMNDIKVQLSSGDGPVYAVALASAWSQNEGTTPAGHLVDANREFLRRVSQPTVAGSVRITDQRVSPSGSAVQGEEVVAVVSLDVPNELEYLAVEVPKPAGCEPLNPLSGWDATLVRIDDKNPGSASESNGIAIYREEHDDRSVFFLSHVDAGKWEIRFGMRAVFAGDYRAAPVTVEAMYAPEIRANSDARRVRIEPAAD